MNDLLLKKNNNYMPDISIIIPSYNSSPFIKRTITSVLKQSYQNWELLIVDDCSTDNTTQIVENFINNDKRIRLIRMNHNSGGPAAPKNIGIKNASSDYIAFLDHDDEWLQEKLKKQITLFRKGDDSLAFVGCKAILSQSDGKINFHDVAFYRGNIFKNILCNLFILSSTGIIVRKKVFNKIGMFDESLKSADDFDMWLRIAQAGYNFDYVDDHLYKYHIHGSNITQNSPSQKLALETERVLNKFSKELNADKKALYSLSMRFIRTNNLEKAHEYLKKSLLLPKNFNILEFKILLLIFLLFFKNKGLNFANFLINKYLLIK